MFNIGQPIANSIEIFISFLATNLAEPFNIIGSAILSINDSFLWFFKLFPPIVFILLLAVLALWKVGWRLVLFIVVGLLFVDSIGMWPQAVATVSLTLTATIFAVIIGVGIGILVSTLEWFEMVVNPILDFMQTMPAYVYLIPGVMFFGLGTVPAVVSTVIFAVPPPVRLTNLGIRQVPHEVVEAGIAYGCSPWQLLLKVKIPLAMPSIMAGINQAIMLSLSMIVLAAMIGAEGLGVEVLRGITKLQVGQGFLGGLGIVVIAIIIDRLTQSFSKNRVSKG